MLLILAQTTGYFTVSAMRAARLLSPEAWKVFSSTARLETWLREMNVLGREACIASVVAERETRTTVSGKSLLVIVFIQQLRAVQASKTKLAQAFGKTPRGDSGHDAFHSGAALAGNRAHERYRC